MSKTEQTTTAPAAARVTAQERAAATRFGVAEAEGVTQRAGVRFTAGSAAFKRALAETIAQLRAAQGE